MVRVPFRGGGEAVSALLSGTTPIGFYGIANVRSQLEAGTVVGLMVDSDKRSPLFPNIPTIPEATQKSFESRAYFGLLAPGRHAQADRRAAAERGRAHRRPAGLPQPASDRAWARADRQQAGGVRAPHQGGSRPRRADRQGGRPRAAMRRNRCDACRHDSLFIAALAGATPLAAQSLSEPARQGDPQRAVPAAPATSSSAPSARSCTSAGASRSWWRTGRAAGSSSPAAPARKRRPTATRSAC